MLAATPTGLDLQTLTEWALYYRPVLEIAALVLTAALVGFLCARWMYRAKVKTRTEHLRFEQARWRRRLSLSRSAIRSVASERDRSLRRLRQARTAKTREAAAAANAPT
jgi:hypothetical protein